MFGDGVFIGDRSGENKGTNHGGSAGKGGKGGEGEGGEGNELVIFETYSETTQSTGPKEKKTIITTFITTIEQA